MKINLDTKKKISKSVESFVMIGIGIIVVISMIIIYMYHSTKTWKQSKLNTTYAEAPAEFVSNSISDDIVSDIEVLSDVQQELNRIAETGDMTSKSQKVYDKARSTLEKLQITSGESYDNTNRLKLYLDIKGFIDSAYNNPDSQKLQDLLGQITREVLDHDRDIDKKMASKLDTVVSDYVQLNDFLNNTLTKIGKVDHKELVIFNYVTNLGEVETKLNELSKFPKIAELKKLINKDITSIFDNNKAFKERLDWLQAKTKLDKLNGSYTKLSDIKTLKDAKRMGYTLKEQYSRDGYELDDESEISNFYYQGRIVSNSYYASDSVKLTVSVNPKWKKVEGRDTRTFEERLEDYADKVPSESDNSISSTDAERIEKNVRSNNQSNPRNSQRSQVQNNQNTSR